jgi:hypothetical protein
MSASYEAFGDLEQTMHATGGGLHFSQVPHLLKPALGLHLCLATRVVGWHTWKLKDLENSRASRVSCTSQLFAKFDEM